MIAQILETQVQKTFSTLAASCLCLLTLAGSASAEPMSREKWDALAATYEKPLNRPVIISDCTAIMLDALPGDLRDELAAHYRKAPRDAAADFCAEFLQAQSEGAVTYDELSGVGEPQVPESSSAE